jgi:5-formyltetrahydrofolate cyclo-ligase
MHCEKAAAKAALRKQLRARGAPLTPRITIDARALPPRRSRGCPQFAAGRRVALYLPFDARSRHRPADRGGAAARRARLRTRWSSTGAIVEWPFYPLKGKTRRGTFGIRVPERATHALPRAGSISSSSRRSASTRRAAPRDGRRIL